MVSRVIFCYTFLIAPFPNGRREADLTPFPKRNHRNDLKDYRSKSVFTPFRKLSSYVPMNMNVRKTNGVKLLAAVMAMAMVFVGASVILSDSEVNAAPATDDLINLTNDQDGINWEFTSETKTLALNGVNLDQGFYYNGDLTITVAGDNTITVNTTAEAGTSAFAAIYATGIITIQDDDSDATTDELTITVNGKTTGSGGSEWTYGIYAGKELSIF